jgi:photosystem II stability/assembly factor-like uncharacterized protein
MMSKTARLTLSLLCPTLALFGLYSLISLGHNTSSNNNSEEEDAQHPGYYEQWFQEKKDANGQIPPFLRSQWAQYDAKKLDRRAGTNPIDTVIELGPNDVAGRTRALWIDPRNEKIILAGAISGGLWRSENGGTSWKPINEQEVSMMPSALTSNPFNPNVIYYGTGESRANSADVDGEGVFKSTDGGKTFQQLASTVNLSGFNAIWDIEHAKIDSQTLFVGTNSNGLYRSTDAGASWSNVYSGGNKQINDILCLPSGRVMATMQSNIIVASDSNGKPGTFKTVIFPNAPNTGTYRTVQLDYCRKFPKVVYAVFEGFAFDAAPVAFYKSSDGGVTWKAKTAPTAAGPGYQAYCMVMGVHPTDTNRVVVGGRDICRTSNGGTSWTPLDIGHSDHHSFAFLPKTTNEFLMGTDGGVFKYQWTSTAIAANLNTGYRVTQFYCGGYGPSGMVGISGAQDNGTQVSSKPLVSQRFFGGDGAYCNIGQQDGSIAYMSYQNDAIHVMNNFTPNNPGNTTNIVDSRFTADGVDFINLFEMNLADQNMVFYRTNKYLYRTMDMGYTWDQMTTSLRAGIKAIGISRQENPVVYFGGTAAQLYKIEHAATAIPGKEVNYNASVPSAVTNDLIKGMTVHPKNPYVLYVAFSNISNEPRVWRVSGLDSVTNKPMWKNISGDLPPGLPVNMMAVDPYRPDEVFFAGTDFGLYYSIDSGKTWNKDYRVPNVAVHEVKMRDDRTLFAFTHGRGMFALPLVYMEAPVSVSRLSRGSSIKLYPNPSSTSISVRGAMSLQSRTYRIYNLQGEVVLEGDFGGGVSGGGSSTGTVSGGGGSSNGSGYFGSGDASTIPTANLPNGTYFLQLQGDKSRAITTKFIVQH